ncbi:MAG: cation:proton antiporter regulatory subunit [Desertimonas sp.]
MAIVRETKLPGIGVRQEFITDDGTTVGVLAYHDGRHDVLVYDRDDPDVCTAILQLEDEDTNTLAQLLGASQLTEGIGAVQQQIEGLLLEWIALPLGSPAVGTTIGEGMYRTRTGASIIAVIRRGTSIPAPGPDFALNADDTIVATGTGDGVAALRELLVP